jgi:hypothetical protein
MGHLLCGLADKQRPHGQALSLGHDLHPLQGRHFSPPVRVLDGGGHVSCLNNPAAAVPKRHQITEADLGSTIGTQALLDAVLAYDEKISNA